MVPARPPMRKVVGLFVVSAPDGDREILIEQNQSKTFGYSGCDINLPFDMVRKSHFRITGKKDEFYLESLNDFPLTVKDRKVRAGFLENEAVIDLGVVDITYYRQFQTIEEKKTVVCPVCRKAMTEVEQASAIEIQGTKVHPACAEHLRIEQMAQGLAKIGFRLKETRINILEMAQLRVIGYLNDKRKVDLTEYVKWSLNPPNYAQIQGGSKLVGLQKGDVTLTATFRQFTTSVVFTITDSPLKQLEIFSSTQEVPLGEQISARAFGLYEDGSRRDITYLVTWFHGPPGTLCPMADRAHVFKTQMEETVSIQAQSQDLWSNTLEVCIKPPCPKELLLRYPGTTLSLGRRDPIQVSCLYSDGVERPNRAQLHWQTFPRKIVRVEETPEGFFLHPIRAGEVQVKAHTLTLSSKLHRMLVGPARVTGAVILLPPKLIMGQVYRPALRVTYDNNLTSEIYDGFDLKINRPGAIKTEEHRLIPMVPGQVQIRINYDRLDLLHKVTISSADKSFNAHGKIRALRIELGGYQLGMNEETTFTILGEYEDGAILEMGRQAFIKILNGPAELDQDRHLIRMKADGPVTLWAGAGGMEAHATINGQAELGESSEDPSQSRSPSEESPQASAVAPARAVVDAAGDTIGPYLVLKLINEGGMGKIFLARKEGSPQQFAIKVMSESFRNTQRKLENFRHEAKVAMMLNHPNIVHVFEFVERDDLAYLVMEYVDGVALATVIHRLGRLELREALKVIQQIAAAVEYAHLKGVIHRDIKPANILVDRKWRAKLLDFGLNRLMGDPVPDAGTETRMIHASVGTPNFMAPEQIIDSDKVDRRADLYSLGATLYNCLTGAAPWEGKPEKTVMENQVKRLLPPISKTIPGMPELVDQVVAKLMAKRPEDRYRSAREFLQELIDLDLSESRG